MKENKTIGTNYEQPMSEVTVSTPPVEKVEFKEAGSFYPQSNTMGEIKQKWRIFWGVAPEHSLKSRRGYDIEDWWLDKLSQVRKETIREIDNDFCGNMHIIREEAGKNQLLLISKVMKAFKRALLSKDIEQ